MIKTFKDKATEAVFNGYKPPSLSLEVANVARRKLKMLHFAHNIGDLKIPVSNCLEQLKRDRKGLWSIRINKQWRICFNWHEGNAYDVEIVDYH